MKCVKSWSDQDSIVGGAFELEGFGSNPVGNITIEAEYEGFVTKNWPAPTESGCGNGRINWTNLTLSGPESVIKRAGGCNGRPSRKI